MSRSIRESIKIVITKRFAPAINFKAPYAIVMLDAVVDDITSIVVDFFHKVNEINTHRTE